MHGDEGVLRCLQARELLQRPSSVRRPVSLTPTAKLAVPLAFLHFSQKNYDTLAFTLLRPENLQARRKLLFTEPLACTLGLEATLRGHRGCVNRLAWSQDGTLLASGSDDRQVRSRTLRYSRLHGADNTSSAPVCVRWHTCVA